MPTSPSGRDTTWDWLYSWAYNPEINSSKEKAFEAQDKAGTAMDAVAKLYEQYSNDPPSLIKGLSKLGVWDAKGNKINWDAIQNNYVDKGAVQDTLRTLNEDATKQYGTASRMATNMGQRTGNLQSSAMQNAMLAQAIQNQRQNIGSKLGVLQGLRQQGEQRAMGMGNSDLASQQLAMNAGLQGAQQRAQAAGYRAQNAADYAGAQASQKGLLQDPEALLGTALKIGTGIATGGASLGLDGIISGAKDLFGGGASKQSNIDDIMYLKRKQQGAQF